MNKSETTWWEKAVAYQIYPSSFQDSNGDGIGDIQGIIQRLPYLKKLGIDILWISPIYDSPKDDNGYDISDYKQIDKQYGTSSDFDRLLEVAHSMEIRVIMDLVINHTSDRHAWFVESRSSLKNPKRDWYIWRDGKDGKEPNNWESIFGGSVWEYDERTKQYYMHVFGATMPDINWENADVKRELFEMINWWIERGVDGFRVDAITHIHKPDLSNLPEEKGKKYVSSFTRHMNQPGIHNHLRQLHDEAFAPHDIFTVAEANGVLTDDILRWVGSKEGKFNSLFQFEHHSLWDTTGEDTYTLPKLKEIFTKWQEITKDDGNIALMLENHDLPRSLDRFGTTSEVYREQCAKCLSMMYMLQKGVPFIYQGQEIGMTNADFTSAKEFRDPPAFFRHNERMDDGMSEQESFDVMIKTERDNARTPMQWDERSGAGFTAGIPWIGVNSNHKYINVAVQELSENSILSFYKKLIALRKEYKALAQGEYKLLLPDDEQIFAYTRTLDDEKHLILCNMSAKKAVFDLPYTLNESELLLANEMSDDENTLSAYECRLYKIK